jgi:hypothetical protein
MNNNPPFEIDLSKIDPVLSQLDTFVSSFDNKEISDYTDIERIKTPVNSYAYFIMRRFEIDSELFTNRAEKLARFTKEWNSMSSFKQNSWKKEWMIFLRKRADAEKNQENIINKN